MVSGTQHDLFAWLASRRDQKGYSFLNPPHAKIELPGLLRLLVQGRHPYTGLSALARARFLAHAVVWSSNQVAIARGQEGLLGLYTPESTGYSQYVAEQKTRMEFLGLLNPVPDLERLPPRAWYLHLEFTLATPLMTADDRDLWVVDHPVRKDHVFGVPYVAATSWKGLLKAAMLQCFNKDKADGALRRLFGHAGEGGEGVEAQAGALHFFSTFFFRPPTLEVFNPHSRTTGAGRDPFYMEAIPKGAQGAFDLLYWPLPAAEGTLHTGAVLEGQAATDRAMVVKALVHLLTRAGVGAKTSSAFGLADPKSLSGWLYFDKERHEFSGDKELLAQGGAE